MGDASSSSKRRPDVSYEYVTVGGGDGKSGGLGGDGGWKTTVEGVWKTTSNGSHVPVEHDVGKLSARHAESSLMRRTWFV